MLVIQLCYIKTKMYRLYRKMTIYLWSFLYIIYTLLGSHLWIVLYSNPCYNEPCYKEVNVYKKWFLDEYICCGYSLEAPHPDASNEFHNIWFYWEIRKISAFFGWKKHLLCCYGSCRYSTSSLCKFWLWTWHWLLLLPIELGDLINPL